MRARSDAERNDRSVLDAARELFAGSDRDGRVSVDDVAARAGVGKGTVFRAFGDRAGLLRALVSEHVGPVQQQLEESDGTDPTTRVVDTLEALLAVKVEHRRLFLALDEVGAGSPFGAETYGWWFDRLRRLAAQADVTDPDFTAHLLLGSVRSDLVEHLLQDGWTDERLRRSVRAGARRLMTSG